MFSNRILVHLNHKFHIKIFPWFPNKVLDLISFFQFYISKKLKREKKERKKRTEKKKIRKKLWFPSPFCSGRHRLTLFFAKIKTQSSPLRSPMQWAATVVLPPKFNPSHRIATSLPDSDPTPHCLFLDHATTEDSNPSPVLKTIISSPLGFTPAPAFLPQYYHQRLLRLRHTLFSLSNLLCDYSTPVSPQFRSPPH